MASRFDTPRWRMARWLVWLLLLAVWTVALLRPEPVHAAEVGEERRQLRPRLFKLAGQSRLRRRHLGQGRHAEHHRRTATRLHKNLP